MLNGSDDELGCFSMIAWSIWLARNQLVFARLFIQILDMVSCVWDLWIQFLNCQKNARSKFISPPVTHLCASPLRFLKINVDAAVIRGKNSFGVGLIARDEHWLLLITQVQCVCWGSSYKLHSWVNDCTSEIHFGRFTCCGQELLLRRMQAMLLKLLTIQNSLHRKYISWISFNSLRFNIAEDLQTRQHISFRILVCQKENV